MAQRADSVGAVGRFFADGLRALWADSEGRKPALDAMRSMAVLLVCMVHWPTRFYGWGGVDVGLHKLPGFHQGHIGVDAFFVLSGYLIGRQIWKEHAATGTVHFPSFFVRRSLRIWPYYYFALAFWSFVARAPENGPARLCEIFFFANYTGVRGIPGSWSLSTEEQFYILAPLLVIVGRRFLRAWEFLPLLAGLWIAQIVARAIELHGALAAGETVPYLEGLHVHSEGLLAGTTLALVSVLRPAWFREGRTRRGWLVFAASVIVAAALMKVQPKIFNFTALAIVFTGLAYALLVDRSILAGFFRLRVFQVVSVLTFGIYLNQFLILGAFASWWAPLTRDVLSPGVAFFLGFALSVIACVAAAVVTYVLIEHPFLVLRDRLLAKMRRKAEVPPVPMVSVPVPPLPSDPPVASDRPPEAEDIAIS